MDAVSGSDEKRSAVTERLASEVLGGELAQAIVTEPMTSPRLEVEHLLDETLLGLVPGGA